ncbi:MAG: restriction endonuclease subunit S, partial [Candidatus Izemoplasmatales bacterium]
MISTNQELNKYKDSVFDEIPYEWKIEKLGENSSLKARIGWQGLTTSEYLNNGDYYLVTGTDFKNGKIFWAGCHFVSKSRFDQDINIQIRDQDILVTKDGTIGKVAIIDNFKKRGTLNSGVFVIRPLNKAYVPLYMYYVLLSKVFTNFLDKLAAGSTISHLYQKDFVSFKFLIPPTDEQKQIATVLSDTDKLIESLEKLIDKKKNIKQGTMQQLLTGKKRLEGYTKSWININIGDYCSVTTGKLDANAMNNSGKYRFYTCAKEYYYIDTYAFDTEALLVSGNGANVGYIHYYQGKFNAYQRTYVLTNFSQDIMFIKYKMDIALKRRIEKEVNAGNTPYIKMDTLTKMSITIPVDLDEQKAIA